MAVKVRSGGGWIDVADAGGSGISTVRQYSDNESPRTERTCTNPITTSGSTIGIGTTSNAYGSKYVQTADPTTSDGGSHTVCDGDLWYDTSDADGGNGGGGVPVGGIIMYSGTSTELNALGNWKLCDGSNGTPNLKDKFVIGADQYSSGWKTNVTGSLTQSGGSKDAVVVSHSHTWQRQDAQNDAGYRPWPASNNDVKSTDVQTSTEGVSGTDKNLPPYYTLAYIMRVS